MVELYLTKLNLLVVPNTSFKFSCAQQILISRNGTLKDLESKTIRALNQILYERGEKSIVVSKVRIWKASNNNVEEILELTKKWKNFTQVTFDGLLLDDEKVEDMQISNEDILIVELPKDKDWVF